MVEIYLYAALFNYELHYEIFHTVCIPTSSAYQKCSSHLRSGLIVKWNWKVDFESAINSICKKTHSINIITDNQTSTKATIKYLEMLVHYNCTINKQHTIFHLDYVGGLNINMELS